MSATMNATVYTLTLVADAPLHHGAFGGDTGNAVLHRRVPLAAYPDHPGVPAVSGNALRGALRRLVMRDLFARLDLGLHSVGTELTAQQWDKLYGALANGGHLAQAETRTDPEAQRALRAAVPALSVFGAAVYHGMLPGRVSVGWLWPRCAETVAAGLAPEPDGTAALVGAEALLTEVTLTRHVDRDEQDPQRSGVTPMPVTVEALVPGTTLHGTVVALRALTPVEAGVVGWGLGQLAILGGKGGAGFGRVRVAHDVPESATAAYTAWRADAAALGAAREALLALARAVA